jgi:citrate lyase gamma subunit
MNLIRLSWPFLLFLHSIATLAIGPQDKFEWTGLEVAALATTISIEEIYRIGSVEVAIEIHIAPPDTLRVHLLIPYFVRWTPSQKQQFKYQITSEMNKILRRHRIENVKVQFSDAKLSKIETKTYDFSEKVYLKKQQKKLRKYETQQRTKQYLEDIQAPFMLQQKLLP